MGGRNFPNSFVEMLPVPGSPSKEQPVTFTEFISRPTIDQRITPLARAIVAECLRADPKNKVPPLFMVMLHGAMPFALALAQEIALQNPDIEPQLETMQYASYGSGTAPSIMRHHKQPDPAKVRGRQTYIIEDIVDGGETMLQAVRRLRALAPASLSVVTLVQRERGVQRLLSTAPALAATDFMPDPPPTYANEPIPIDYAGFTVKCGYVVGFGMDLGNYGKYRSWPAIYAPVDPERSYVEPPLPQV